MDFTAVYQKFPTTLTAYWTLLFLTASEGIILSPLTLKRNKANNNKKKKIETCGSDRSRFTMWPLLRGHQVQVRVTCDTF